MSLLEVLIALAISSVLILVTMQGAVYWVSMAERVSASSDRLQEAVAYRTRLEQVVGFSVSGWWNRPEDRFAGERNALAGLTARPLLQIEPGLRRFSLRFEGAESGPLTDLVYDDGHGRLILARGLGPESAFAFLGRDAVWHEAWPLQDPEVFGYDNDAADRPAFSLPLAVRVCLDGAIRLECHIISVQRAGIEIMSPDTLLMGEGDEPF